MGRHKERHYPIFRDLFEEELKLKGLSINKLGNPRSKYFIGINEKTIRRGVKNGWFTASTIAKLSSVMDIASFTMDSDSYKELVRLRKENEMLKKTIQEIASSVQKVYLNLEEC